MHFYGREASKNGMGREQEREKGRRGLKVLEIDCK
jgi:hypothetical protein